MKTLSIDIETYSSANLQKCGVYKYCQSEDFEILLFAYSVDDDEVQVVDFTHGETLPEEIIKALTDSNVTKTAFNATFERICISKFLGYPDGKYLDPSAWRCTMIHSLELGLPGSLKGVGAVLGLEKQKLEEGAELVRFFCTPMKSRDGKILRRFPKDNPSRWERFKEYNKRDVEVELQIKDRLKNYPLPDSEWEHYIQDQKINDRGVLLDMKLVDNALELNNTLTTQLIEEAKEITGLENPNSVLQLKNWLIKNGVEVETLNKEDVNELIKTTSGRVKDVLKIRQELSKSSIKKYEAMKNAAGSDNRARGLIQFYGANRTGRYSGRLIQVQNLPQNHLPDLDTARALLLHGNFGMLDLLYDSVPQVLSELIRTAFIAGEHKKYYVADFAAIEARVIAWYAGCQWRQDVFKNGEDIYCESASQMFHVPVKKNGINAHLRQKGKIAELALGYGGGVGALTAMGALSYGLNEEELQPLVTAWRDASPEIVKFWWDVDKAVKSVVKTHKAQQTHGIGFSYKSGILFVTLPSGRQLAYVKPMIGVNQFGGESVTYEGAGTSRKWERLESYGPKFVENIVQATARDILAEAMQRLEECGYKIVMHVHDEVIIEAGENESIDTICQVMAESPIWAKTLLLRADGYTCYSYRKE